jgi:hypothetical protein
MKNTIIFGMFAILTACNSDSTRVNSMDPSQIGDNEVIHSIGSVSDAVGAPPKVDGIFDRVAGDLQTVSCMLYSGTPGHSMCYEYTGFDVEKECVPIPMISRRVSQCPRHFKIRCDLSHLVKSKTMKSVILYEYYIGNELDDDDFNCLFHEAIFESSKG